jgi:hypothetical protein
VSGPAQTRREFLRLGLAGVGAVPWLASGCAGPGAGLLAPADGPAVFVILSGGGTPLTNNYSQYLQARAWAGWLARTRPTAPRWCFFGVGNREGSPAVLADTYREVERDGGYEPEWLPGFLPDTRPATREALFRALREEILPVVRNGGTLFLLVGDHGELAGRDAAQESAITMWQLKRGGRQGWRTDGTEVLGVAELRRELAAGIGRGRVLFGMTQCHSGGFHELAVPRALVPPRAWFSRDPEGIAGRPARLQLAAAGFTATDQASPAAGCEPDPEPDRWAGYERFFPEALLGADLMTGAARGAPAPTLDAAHEAAVLVDHTIDKPRSTSEHYLEAWARVIEERLATTLAITEPVQRAVAAFQRAVDTGHGEVADPAWAALRERYRRFQAALIAQLPTGRALLQLGDRRRLTAALRPVAEPARDVGARRRNALTAARRAWSATLRPAWKAAVEADRVPGLGGPALDFERHLLRLEDEGRSLLLGRRDGEALLQEVYWRSGYAQPGSVDAAAARAVARWGVARRERIAEWGRTAAELAVRTAAEQLAAVPPPEMPAGPGLTLPIAADRVLFQRRVLAAWRFLLEVGHAPALAELAQLRALEITPLPPVGAGVPSA